MSVPLIANSIAFRLSFLFISFPAQQNSPKPKRNAMYHAL